MGTATTVTPERVVQEILASNIAIHKAMHGDKDLISGVARAAAWIGDALRKEHRLLLIGNGGSAADAQHLATEFVGRYRIERRALPAMALTVNTSVLTALGNDYGFDDVFTRQVEAFAQPGDILLCISTSGNSRNIIRAALLASALHVKTIGLTGADGGKLRKCVDLCLCVPSNETPRIQEAHTLIGHMLAEIVETALPVAVTV